MPQFPVVVVGASAGGVEPLKEVVAALPPDFPGAVFVVLHIPPYSPSHLPHILSQAGPLPALHPEDGEPVLPGHIYVAPPDHHLLVEGNQVGVKNGPKENRFRPSVDALFRSAAYTCGAGVIGVVLSGVLDDGASGLWTVKRRGGLTVVQDPADAQFDSMPVSALEYVDVDYSLPAAEIGGLLAGLVGAGPSPEAEVPMSEEENRQLEVEVQIAAGGHALRLGLTDLGQPSPFSCPECQGVLYTLKDGTVTRFRCHTGHAYSMEALLTEVSEDIEGKLYQTLRAMEEGVMLLRRMGEQAVQAGDTGNAAHLLEKVRQVERQSELLQRLTQQAVQSRLDDVLPSSD
ncbi:chemotaxis protein CheB [Deinococcus metallilatus]|uniref:protein-glutamate methylesterase n=1 Tax=Deinococcus metallilatus TaxID=1211322 RepID=A0AAJ5K0S8_9DEIO|nr:chemotaxis protein CheB [Deinococcus metallilatus]MBB5294585.1 two-component system chemotaxis response regulator CheB [Deinococcus metallilatus]QBY07627.1 chemotaxis protein CheB [Deinococcus metallilatus]RXJ14043.1 chemotaxis protein CheB [Deinococcus metallilatus]TLK30008.1 chemotaxis protein CheB [Deinococcus metallilatus]GMA15799.1 chemotaxis protein CheB [Deinococcus metallilatus]